MDSTAERVARYLSRDGVVQESLRRGIVNHRALARWMIDHNGWDATEEAVVSALRRFADQASNSVFDEAREVFADAQLAMRAQVCVFVVSKDEALPQRLSRLFERVDFTKGETLRLIQSERSITIIVDESNRQSLEEQLGSASLERVATNVTEIDVFTPPEALHTPGVLATILLELATRGINLVEFVSGSPEALVFVDEADGLQAYRALTELVEDAQRVGEAGDR